MEGSGEPMVSDDVSNGQDLVFKAVAVAAIIGGAAYLFLPQRAKDGIARTATDAAPAVKKVVGAVAAIGRALNLL